MRTYNWPIMSDIPLLKAAWSANGEKVRDLLTRGADPNAVNDRGQTALYLAASCGFSDVVGILLAAGAVIDPQAADFVNVLRMAEQARMRAYAQAVELVRTATGVTSAAISEPRQRMDRFPEARSFFINAEAATQQVVDRFIGDLRPQLAALGALLLGTGQRAWSREPGTLVVMLPTADQFTALAACSPEPGFAYGPAGLLLPDVVAWFRQLHQTHPYTLWGAGLAFVDISFDQPVEDVETLVGRIRVFCPKAIEQGEGTEAGFIEQVRHQRRIQFRW